MSCFEEKDHCIVLNVRVVPRASKDEIAGAVGGALKVRVKAPPVDGKANAHLIRFLASHWNIPKGCIIILSGETGRNKRISISNPTDELRKELLSAFRK